MIWRCLMAVSISIMLLTPQSIFAQENDNGFHPTIQIGRGRIQSVYWHPDSMRLVVNSATGAWIYTDHLNVIAHLKDVRLAVFSPDGEFLAGVDSSQRIVLWEDGTFTPVGVFDAHTQAVVYIAWSPDGRLLASADKSGRFMVWNVQSRELYFEYEAGYSYSDHQFPFAWSPDGNQLALNGSDQQTLIWNVDSRDFTQSLEVNGKLVWRNEQQLVVFNEYDELAITRVFLWDIVTGKELVRYDMSGYGFKFSPDAKLAATAWAWVEIVNADTGLVLDKFYEGNFKTAFVWKQNSTLLAVATGGFSDDAVGTIRIVDTATNTVVRFFSGHVGTIHPKTMAWSPDGKKLVSGGMYYSELATWDVINGYQMALLYEHSLSSSAIAWSPDGEWLLTGDASGAVQIWDSHTGEHVAMLSGHEFPVSAIEWQPGGSLLATSDYVQDFRRYGTNIRFESVRVWEMSQLEKAKKPIALWSGKQLISGMAWNRQGTELAAINSQSEVWIWGAFEKQTVRELASLIGGGFLIHGIEWDYAGKHIAVPVSSPGNGGTVTLWDAQTGDPHLQDSEFSYSAVAPLWASVHRWTPDNSYIWSRWSAYGCGGVLPRHYSIPVEVGYSGSELWPIDFSVQMDGMPGFVESATFNSDGTRLAGLDEYSNITVWDTLTGNQLFLTGLFGHPVYPQISWSPDDRFWAGWGENLPIIIFDAETGEHYDVINPQISEAYSLTWSPDSRQLAVGDEGVIMVWSR